MTNKTYRVLAERVQLYTLDIPATSPEGAVKVAKNLSLNGKKAFTERVRFTTDDYSFESTN